MADSIQSNPANVPAKKTTEEKIRIAIAFLQRQGYQVISRHSAARKSTASSDVQRRMDEERNKQLSAIQTAATLNSKEVAAIMGVCVATIEKWTKSGAFPAPLPLPGRKRWNAETITAYMRNRGMTVPNSLDSTNR